MLELSRTQKPSNSLIMTFLVTWKEVCDCELDRRHSTDSKSRLTHLSGPSSGQHVLAHWTK